MLFRSKSPQKSLKLKPFAFKLKDGYLVGQAMDPEYGAPCKNCVLLWLRERNVEAEPTPVETLPGSPKKELEKIISLNSPHVFQEISNGGTIARLHCLVFPHYDCRCSKKDYVAPTEVHKDTNFAFSPIYQLKCVRYGTPGGNLWFFSASGQSPYTKSVVSANAAHPEKEIARIKCVETWIKKATIRDLKVRIISGEKYASEDFQTGTSKIFSRTESLTLAHEEMGIGKTKEEATINALNALAKVQIIQRYSDSLKKPMLMVGTNNWIRQRVPFFLIQQYDLYLMFYPNQSPSWVIGLAAFSRLKTSEPPIFSFGASANIHEALSEALYSILEKCRPSNWRKDNFHNDEKKAKNSSQMNLWWNNWIYKCPKISLKDVLQLDPYENSLERWKQYYGEVKSEVVTLNNDSFPKKIRHLIKLQFPKVQTQNDTPKVRGIGTWSKMKDSVLHLV